MTLKTFKFLGAELDIDSLTPEQLTLFELLAAHELASEKIVKTLERSLKLGREEDTRQG